VALVNSTIDTLKKNLYQERGQTEPGLVAFYVIRPGNRASLFFQSQSLYGQENNKYFMQKMQIKWLLVSQLQYQ